MAQNLLVLLELQKIKVLSNLNEYLDLEHVDIAISVQYHEILKKQHIEKAKEIIVNLHMAPLPEYRGCNQFSTAIINGDIEFGTTIHRLEEGIDSGAILAEKRFPIPDKFWVNELFELTVEKSFLLFKEQIRHIVTGNYSLKMQSDLCIDKPSMLNYRKDIEKYKHIDLNWNKDKISRYIRATSMPGFEPPFATVSGKKIYFIRKIQLEPNMIHFLFFL